ncbi:MAG: hypothetical protein VCE75_25945 [Alphaproteobacteria bacterium]
MKFDPKNWCENQINLARIEIQLKYFVEDKAHLKDLWDGVLVGYSFRENADRAARAQTQSLIEIHKIIPNFVDNKEKNTVIDENNKINKEVSPLEYINYEISNNIVCEFEKLTKTNKSIIIEHLKDNFYRISILSETIKSENELESLVKEKIKNNSN